MQDAIEVMPAETPADAVALLVAAYGRTSNLLDFALSEDEAKERVRRARATLRNAIPVLARAHGVELSEVGGLVYGLARRDKVGRLPE